MSEPAFVTSTSERIEMEKQNRVATSAALTELRHDGKLCDVVIKVDDVEFDAHKVILCGCSPYFCTLFTGAWSTSDKQIYTIPGVSPDMMYLIINYAYTHSVPVTADNVVEILAAADQFMVSGITQTCCFFLEDHLCEANCIGIWRVVDFYHCSELSQKVFLYILHYFEDIVCVSQELLELSVQQIEAIIENDRLNVKQENTAFEAVVRWINHLPDQRRGHLSELLSKVRLGLMTVGYLLNNVIDNPLILNSVECMPIINEAVNTITDFRANRNPKSVHRSLMNRPRVPSTILLVTGGILDNIPANGLEAYDARAKRWATVSNQVIRRAYHGAAVLNNFVYLIGGCSNQVHLNTVDKFDMVTCTWHLVAPMKFLRCFVSVTVQNGVIYAIGGFNGHAYHNSVECYNPETDRWTMVAPMHSKRCGASSTTLNGKVYICGGFNGRRCLSTAECYDPHTNQWTMITPMRNSRSGLGIAAYRDRIYAVGGAIFGSSPLCSVEAYNPRTNRWSTVPSMQSPRSYFGIGVLDDQLIVVGGLSGSATTSAVEHYDEDTGMWYSANYTDRPRSGLSCCVLHGLNNVVENLFPCGPLMLPNMKEAEGGFI